MTDDLANIKNITFRYDTIGMPPPFCHRYELTFSPDTVGPQVDFRLEYYDRDEMTEEEIFEEGFSLSDDFAWSGKLPAVWNDVVLEKLKKTNWNSEEAPGPNSMETLEIAWTERKMANAKGMALPKPGKPDQVKAWTDFLQEMIQAIYEVSKKELPLFIQYLKIERSSSRHVQLTFEFAHRKAVVEVDGEKKPLDWEKGKKLIRNIFVLDYDVENARETQPKKRGKYLETGDGLWYDLQKNIASPTQSKDQVKILMDELDDLLI